ncbi:MAG: beta-propeller domain-containing protein [Candidatus Gracilibacteria bacterium]
MNKYLITLVVLALAIGTTATTYAGRGSEATVESTVFDDLSEEHPMFDAISYLKDEGILQGYDDGQIKADNTINRAEFATILARTLSEYTAGENCFDDVKDEWFAGPVCYLKSIGVISGYSDGLYHPEFNINFAEAAKIITLTLGTEVEALGADDPWYKPFVISLEGENAIPVSIDYLDKLLSRADMSEIIFRLDSEDQDEVSKSYESLISEFPLIGSCGELVEKMDLANYSNRWRGEKGGGGMTFTPASIDTADSAEEEDAGDDFSSTNVQVTGVDEADIIKNDNKYIYIINGYSVRIVDAYPAEEMEEVANLEYESVYFTDDSGVEGSRQFAPQELYVYGDTLIVIGSTTTSGVYDRIATTTVKIYDVSTHSAPNLERNLDIDGYELETRRVGNHLYLITQENAPDYWDTNIPIEELEAESLLPRYSDSTLAGDKEGALTSCEDITFDPHYRSATYLIVSSINLDDTEEDLKATVSMGTGTTIYSSTENLYVASPKYDYESIDTFNVWQPVYTGQSTSIYSFALNNGDVAFTGAGEVPGRILNQFSMDEYDDQFRIATTTGSVSDEANPAYSHIYILDANDLKERVGQLENLAKGENLYSARFVGDIAYLVTFLKVDPFFVIDLEDPKNPEVLGELKIPGYSDYLQPFGENYMIGFGKDTETPTEEELEDRGIDFAWYQGLRLGLFDVTDQTDPEQIFTEIIGDRSTDTELLYNHKALLFDKNLGLIAFPVSLYEIPEEYKEGEDTGSTYGEFVLQGAYVYTLDVEEGFELLGVVTNTEDGNEYDYSKDYIQRAIRIGDYIYTISTGRVKASNLDNLQETVSTVEVE